MDLFSTQRAIILSCTLLLTTSISFLYSDPTAAGSAKHVYGRIEYVNISRDNQLIKAKLDTGAKLSSLSATNIKPYNKNGISWVSFDVYHERKNINIQLDLPLLKQARIKQRHDEDNEKKYSKRPVVLLPVCLRNQELEIQVNLVDRARFIYPMLLGATAIEKFEGLVDPATKFTNRPSCYLKPPK